ncbi:uncharacterized protein LOC101846609 [Aplysia californica]|uniref:Uncharacterized protein LOC101846609 n=1 Tax=Aplysia californica TaxID=6500 RepID=A0ABM0K654_APLCA|nr:uncharacterized protein LOC101846609 [Aplysia californica]
MKANSSLPQLTSGVFMSQEEFLLIFDILMYYVRPPIIVLGLITNSLNILVFYKMGLKDSVNISFFALSLSDGLFILLAALGAVCIVLQLAYQGLVGNLRWDMSLYDINSYIFWYAVTFYDTSMSITVFIAVVRCCCVAIPLKFKGVFTRSRTVVCIVGITVSTVLTRLPTLITQEIVAQYDAINNRTVYRLRYTADRPQAIELNDIMNRTVLYWVAMVTMSICVVVLETNLRSASKFRRSCELQTQDKQATPSDNKPAPQSNRDARVVKMVILVTSLYLVLALPFMLYSLSRRLVPGLDLSGRYMRFFAVITTLGGAFTYLNSSLNAFVYYHTSSGYKKIALSSFRAVLCAMLKAFLEQENI